MNYRLTGFITFICLLLFLPGCEIISGIFQAGLFSGIVIVIIVIALIIWAVKALMNRE